MRFIGRIDVLMRSWEIRHHKKYGADKSFKLFDLIEKVVLVSRDVQVNESSSWD